MENNLSLEAVSTSSYSRVGMKVLVGRILSGLAVVFMLFDSITKLLMTPQVVQGTTKLGYPVSTIPVIGAILLVFTVLYIIPKTSIFAAILLTGYLGGAVASNLRIMSPLFSNTLFPIYFAIILWGGIYLRYNILHEFIPFRIVIVK